MRRVATILAVACLAISILGCFTIRGSKADPETFATRIDVAIITVLPEEYHAVLRKLEDVSQVVEPHGRPNPYAWATGEIRSSDRKTSRRSRRISTGSPR